MPVKQKNTIKQNIRNIVANRVVNFLPYLSDKQIIDIAKLAEKVVPKRSRIIIKRTRQLFENNPGVLNYARRAVKQINYNCRRKMLDNLFLRGFVDNFDTRKKNEEKGDAPIFTLLISPTMRCNLQCQGCYAKNYERKNDLPFDVFDRLIREGKEMGAAFFTILGGEPFLYKGIFEIFERNSDAYFQVYTNGAMVSGEICKKLAELGNVALQFSVEGFAEDTDARRGQGAYDKIMAAMDRARESGLPFGYSACATRNNTEKIVSDEFVDFMIKKGAIFGWHFLYMPVCGENDTKLMPTPEQRLYLKQRIKHIRKTKSIVVVDFWNDAPYVKGCIAARQYCHINSNGDLEPCIFTHFSQANVKNTTLKEALNYPFYKELRRIQPYNENLFLPCMLIDNPQVLRRLRKKYKDLRPTHPSAEVLVNALAPEMNDYSKKVKKVYDKVWKEEKIKPIWEKGD